jgi:predicted nucleic acid-binding protein
VQEFLQGLIDPMEFALGQADLENFHQLPPSDYRLHLRAAEAHVRIKRRGLTIPTIDTLIVTMAQEARCSLLTGDGRQRDLARFLKVRLA